MHLVLKRARSQYRRRDSALSFASEFLQQLYWICITMLCLWAAAIP